MLGSLSVVIAPPKYTKKLHQIESVVRPQNHGFLGAVLEGLRNYLR